MMTVGLFDVCGYNKRAIAGACMRMHSAVGCLNNYAMFVLHRCDC